jgi:hypothetical protein
MQLELYPKLSTRSKRAILKTKKKWGRDYFYTPRMALLLRLSQETGKTVEEVYQQLLREREFLLKSPQYFKG